MLETLNVLKSGDWVEELHPHRTQDWPPVKEEQVAATAGVFHGIFYEFHDSLALELCESSKAEVACGVSM